MQKALYSRRYIILRPMHGSAGGFVRLEMKQGRLSASVRVNQVPAGQLRVLMLSGDPDTGAVIDLGLMRPSPNRQACLYLEDLPAEYTACHTAVICTDWPDAQLLLYGWLTARPVCTLWQVQESVRRYLSVPAGDAPPAKSLPSLDAGFRGMALCALLPVRSG